MKSRGCRYFEEYNHCSILDEDCLLDNHPDELRCNEMYKIIPDENEKSFEEYADEIIEESGDF